MPPFDVSPASPHELLSACRLLFPDRAEQSRERILTEASTSRLFVARAGGKLHAAALVQALPGALGVALPPRGDSAEATDAVTAAACDWLRASGVKVCQAFAAAGEAADMLPLERAGFAHTTQLVMLRRELPPFALGLPPCELSGAFYIPGRREQFEATLLATHEGTLDCPELNARRTPAELVAGFALPDHPWSGYWLAESTDGDVGVFVCDISSDREAFELSYLGVVPSARRRGYGDQLVRRALHAASAAGCSAATLAVDARNTPARKLYARHGFLEYERRDVWLLTCAR